jgi:hypothetical protein
MGALLLVPLTLAACGGSDENPDVTSGGVTSSSGAGGTGDPGGTGGAGDTGGTGGTGGGTGGAGGTFQPGDPIQAPNETWTWVPFDDAFCADGSTTGIGVNLTDKSKDVIIFMMGGGACWDQLTCYLAQTAVNLDGYDEAKFNNDVNGVLASSLFDRADAENPTKDFNFVFVPYCTGDVHSGNAEQEYGGKKTKHVGFANVTAYLSRIVPTFPDPGRVVLSGSSAGGFGAGMNWWRTQQAFGSTRVDMIDDSGPPLPAPYLSQDRENEWRAAWNLDAALPPDCLDCKTSLSALITYYADKFTTQRGALLSYTRDNVISAFYSIQTTKFEEGLKVFTKNQLEGKESFRYFYVDGQSHVLLSNPDIAAKSGVVLRDWLSQMLSDDAGWKSEHPWDTL